MHAVRLTLARPHPNVAATVPGIDDIESVWESVWESISAARGQRELTVRRSRTGPTCNLIKSGEHARFVGNSESTFEHLVIDNDFFGVASVGGNGNECVVAFPQA